MKISRLVIAMMASAALLTACKGDVPPPPPDEEEPPPQETVDYTGLVINEVYSQGRGSVDSSVDWVELYNSAGKEIDLSGVILSNKESKLPKVTIADGTKIPSKGFHIVNVDISGGFGLSSDGDAVWLFDPKGKELDSTEFGPMREAESWSANPDGSNTFRMQTITKGTSNNSGTEVPPDEIDYSVIVINEAYSRGGSAADPGLDWIELYNTSDEEIDISGMMLSDQEEMTGSDGLPVKVTIPEGTLLAAKGFLVVDVDTEEGFGLSSGGDHVWLFDPEGTEVDYTEFGSMRVNESWSRFPDGSEDFRMQTITKNATNDTGTVIPPFEAGDYTGISLNEAYSRGKGTVDPGFDWVEIYNASDHQIDIGGLMLSDTGTLEHLVIPQGTTIASKGFFVIETEDTAGNGFGLSSGGDKVWLYDPAGEQLDHIEFGAMEETESWSAFPDGSNNFRMQAITKGTSNNSVGGDVNYSGLVINEVDGNGKFVELYNTSGAEISLVGVGLTKVTDKNELWWTGGANAVIAPKGFYTIAQEGGAVGADEYTGNGGISPKKNVKFTLNEPDGTELDSFTRSTGLTLDAGCTPDYGSGTKYSFSRCPDGMGAFGLAVPSCGAANPFIPAGMIVTNEATTKLTIVINEVDGNGKFVEIYNTGATAVSLKDVRIVKNLKDVWWTGTTQTIAAGGFYTIAQAGGAVGADEYTGNGGISPKKTVRFDMTAAGMSIDVFARVKVDNVLDANCTPDYGSGTQYSFARTPNGSGAFNLAIPTCGAANGASAGQIITE